MEECNSGKIILDLCGGTGSWSKPYKDNGYDVKLITLPDFNVGDYVTFGTRFIHFRHKNRDISRDNDLIIQRENVYGILAAPPCTQFSFCRTNAREKRNLFSAMEIVKSCLNIIWFFQRNYENQHQKKSPLKFWAMENPNGWLKFFLGKPAYKFNPYDFGDNYKKNTHLWGWFNNPVKTPIKCSMPKFDKMASKDIHPEQFGKLTRQERRAITPQGFAKAFYEANK
jgi:hypothetical protein